LPGDLPQLLFHHAEARHLIPVVKLSSPNYLDRDRGDDWLQYHFDHPIPARPLKPGSCRALRIGNISEMPDFASDLTLAEAHTLFFQHVRVKRDVEAAVDTFCRAHLIGASTLGIHYRGTDKGEETALVGYEAAFSKIATVLMQRPGVTNLFIASDEQEFIDRSAGHFPHLPVITFNDSIRSQDGRPIHLGQRAPGNYLMGRDALMNLLLLSRCGAVARTTSFLSAWSSIFTPGLLVFLLNVPYPGKLWFPEREIIKTATIIKGHASAASSSAPLARYH